MVCLPSDIHRGGAWQEMAHASGVFTGETDVWSKVPTGYPQ